jgi:tripartite-type tricarboxylate transporter receptor subunit TctC
MKIPRAVATRLTAAVVAVICATPATANAQTWPDRAIHLVVPAGPGGPTDVLARLIADRLQQALGQPVIVDNRGGAGGAIGARGVAAALPDGYTLMLGNTATLANIPAVSKNAAYDPVKNFAPIAKLTDSYQLLVVTPAFPAKTVAELIAYAKANSGKLDYAAVGAGNLTHLSGELLKARTGIDFAIVHYKSGAEAMTAVVGGQVQFAIDNVTVVRPLVQDRRLRALAVTSRKRQADFPDLPTMIEAGIPDYQVTSFFGVVAPAATPPEIVDKLNRAINAALRTPEMQTAFANLGAQPATETPQQFAAFIAGELAKWTDLSNSAGIKVD